ncbi:MAG: hypothetical protein PUE69_09445, partial [Ruminococcus sp.]|nr:hypothetical protein [Ruminococcus sp.]
YRYEKSRSVSCGFSISGEICGGKGTLSLAERSLLKNSPHDCFLIHPLQSALQGLSVLDLTKGLVNPLETHYYNKIKY